MGQDKALLELGGKTLLARAIETVSAAVSNVIIVGDPVKFARFGPVIEDEFIGQGPLGGIHAALNASTSELNLMLAVDMAFMRWEFLQCLVRQAEHHAAQVNVPRSEDRLQPLCAVYRKDFAGVAERALKDGKNKITAIFDPQSTLILEDQEITDAGFTSQMFHNVNTPQDWELAQSNVMIGK
jgi:molybdopterin-guanine dinucleotide biosynthesis protein A